MSPSEGTAAVEAAPRPRAARRQTRPTGSTFRSLLLAAAVLAGQAGTAFAGPGWIVELVNGARFESRYRPVEAPWDRSKILLLTDQGNRVSLDRSIVRSVAERAPALAVGRRIDRFTVELGSVPQLPAEGPETSEDPAAAFRRRLLAALEGAPPYTVEQFVEPEEAAAVGLPLAYAATALPPVGSPERFLTAQDRP